VPANWGNVVALLVFGPVGFVRESSTRLRAALALTSRRTQHGIDGDSKTPCIEDRET
jgi:hypothetical protein